MDSANVHGSGALNLRIGDITFALTSDDPSLTLGAEGPVRHFLIAGGEPDVRLRAAWGGPCAAPGEKLFDAGSLWQIYRQGEGYHIRFGSGCRGPEPYKTASFNSDFTSGEIRLRVDCFESNQPVYPMEYPLDELLMMHLLADGRGVEVHGCGVADCSGEGYLFLGKSGAGKSTMARLWTGDRLAGASTPAAVEVPHVLSDDRIILRFFDGRLWMYGTPWHGEAELASSQRTAVSRIFFLGRGEKNEVLPLAEAETVARLVTCSFVPFHGRSGLDFTLAFLQQVTQAVPCEELRFFPDARAVEFVRREWRGNA